MTELKSIHRIVAREMALGIPLKDICESRGLNLGSWYNTVCGELFKLEVKRFEQEIENAVVDEVSSEVVMNKLKALGAKAVGTLSSVMENIEQPASAVSAAKVVLESLGYRKKEEPQKQVVINISGGKLQDFPKEDVSLESIKI